MAEYIEREGLLDSIGSVPPWWGYFEPCTFEQWQGINTTHEAIKKIIKEQPTADVQEVRHGKWIPSIFGTIICSECKERITLFGSDTDKFYYCPNCGAKMDRGDDNA